MKKVVLRAEYKTDNTFNEGHIIIYEKNNQEIIEGIFGLDYVKIDFSDNYTFDLVLIEPGYDIRNHILIYSPKTTIFSSQRLYSYNLYCPEQYLLCSNSNDFLSLSLLAKESNETKANEIFQYLVQLRP